MNADDINNIDWSKIFYALVMAVLMGVQMYHGSEINTIKDVHEEHHERISNLEESKD